MKSAVLAGLVLCTTLSIADNHNVDFDSHTDFSHIKSFSIQDSKITSPRAELNNAIVVAKIHDAIRTELMAKGLKEASVHPDVTVSFSIAEQGYAIGPAGRANPVGGGRGRGRGERDGGDPESIPVDFTEGTLILDLNTVEPPTLVWRGVYRDSEKNSTKLAQKMPGDAKKLLAEYPPKGKK